ncbi:MAG TPA: hypothetical protein ENI06_08050 [Spirochaetales bacterium]|nr:hypothetical protein [Spirochaetales bacterium]
MEVKEGYKQTDVGVIPEDWVVKKLGECLFKNPEYGINAPAVPLFGALPTYIRITDISDDGLFIKNDNVSVNHPQSELYFLEKGDLVFARTGASVGKTYLYNQEDGKLVFAGFLIRIRPRQKILDSKYLKFFTQTSLYWNWVGVNSMRSGQPGINGHEYSQLPIPFPPTKAEQTAIAAALSDADALIQSMEKLIAKKRSIKQGAMQELLKPKKGWVVKKLGEIADINMGQSPSSSNYNASGVGLPLVQGNADIDDRKTIIRNYTSQITKRCNNGDIIMSVRAPVGEIALSTFDACIGRGVCAISYPNAFLYHYLIFIESQWAKYSTGSTFDSVNSDTIWALEINTPPPPEQTRIAAILSDMDAEIAALETKLAKYKQIKEGMMQELLTGRIRLI